MVVLGTLPVPLPMSRHEVLSNSRGISSSPFFAGFAPLTPFLATLARHTLTTSKHGTLTLLLATLTRIALVTPLFATLTKNTRGGCTPYTVLVSPLRYLLTLFLSSTYTHFSFSYEEPCI